MSFFFFNGYIYLEDDMSGCGGFGGDKCGWTWENGCQTEGCPSNVEDDMVRKEAWRKDLTRPEAQGPRTLRTIANEIRNDWKRVNYAAIPYLQAMANLNTVRDDYGCDSGRSIVLYFLSNATTWRGEVAKRVKAELKGMLK